MVTSDKQFRRNTASTATQCANGYAHVNGSNGHQTRNGYVDGEQPVNITGELSDSDREILEKQSAISADAIAARGYWTCEDPDALRHLGFKKSQCLVPALVIPLRNWQGHNTGHVLRPHIPRYDARTGKKIKYEAQPGAAPVIAVAPVTRHLINNLDKPLMMTEGAKKADAVASLGLPAINISGVWNFLLKGIPHPELNEIPMKGRTVAIGFDSDVMIKPSVRKAFAKAAVALQNRGALVKAIFLPDGPNSEKTGLDDFIARRHTR